MVKLRTYARGKLETRMRDMEYLKKEGEKVSLEADETREDPRWAEITGTKKTSKGVSGRP